MSRYDYRASQRIAAQDQPFNALLMAAMRRADTDNLRKLAHGWPDVYRELCERYNNPGGLLLNESPEGGQ